MLDDGTGIGRRTPSLQTPTERATIVAQSFEAGATVSVFVKQVVR